MKRYFIILAVFFMLASGMAISCSPSLQIFNKYGISFKVDKELRLVEYTVDWVNMTSRIGNSSYEYGAVMSTEKNFVFLWVTTIPKFTNEEVMFSILSTPNAFQSITSKFQAAVTGDLVMQDIAGFEVTFAKMRFTLPDWSAPGITAVWYCPDSQRTMQIILINKKAETEMKRFVRSFSCAPQN
ncbi:hypothetical protein ES707_16342 [subsurface metagenome]